MHCGENATLRAALRGALHHCVRARGAALLPQRMPARCRVSSIIHLCMHLSVVCLSGAGVYRVSYRVRVHGKLC